MATIFNPIKQSRISEGVINQIKHFILLGHFKAGERLPPERELAEEFRVSRMAIREALRALELSGFIETRQGINGGAFVTDLTFEHLGNAFLDLFLADKVSIPEMLQVRLLIEPEVARLATLNLNAVFQQGLKKALEAEELPPSSLLNDVEIKQNFHFILAEMSGNRFLEAIVRSLLKLTRNLVLAVDAGPRFIHPAGMHRTVAEAVLSGNPEEAYEAMKKHTLEFGEKLIAMEKTYREKKSLLSF
ncbi:MAG: FadR family transcriptional regulator [Deltaproteobacteria bacterium]|nr:FadR family transcriptional regulator [Deltaproteobacteria bacterium]